MTISEQVEAGRREQRVLTRVSRAAWRLEQAERERTWALVSARAEGISIRTLATAIGLSPSRVHQLVADADLNALEAALGELRAAGWPTAEDPDSGRTPNSAAGCMAGRAIPARRDQPTARLHRQPVPATLTTTSGHSAHQGSSGNLDAVAVLTGPLLPAPQEGRQA